MPDTNKDPFIFSIGAYRDGSGKIMLHTNNDEFVASTAEKMMLAQGLHLIAYNINRIALEETGAILPE